MDLKVACGLPDCADRIGKSLTTPFDSVQKGGQRHKRTHLIKIYDTLKVNNRQSKSKN
jgi:hypothetical protein